MTGLQSGASIAPRHYNRTTRRQAVAAALHEDFLKMEADNAELAHYFTDEDDDFNYFGYRQDRVAALYDNWDWDTDPDYDHRYSLLGEGD